MPIAKAFVDRDMELDGIVEKGKLLTLTPQRAIELGMADVLVNDRKELLEWLNGENAELFYSEMTGAERFTRITITKSIIAKYLTAVATSGVVRKILPIIQPIPPNAKIPKPGVNISIKHKMSPMW